MKYKLTGYFTHVVFESKDLKKNIYVLKIIESNSQTFKAGGTVAVVTQVRQKITGNHVSITGKLIHHATYGFQIEALSVIATHKHNANNSLSKLQDSSSPPEMPKEYYDSMLIEYCNEQEKLYDFFTPED